MTSVRFDTLRLADSRWQIAPKVPLQAIRRLLQSLVILGTVTGFLALGLHGAVLSGAVLLLLVVLAKRAAVERQVGHFSQAHLQPARWTLQLLAVMIVVGALWLPTDRLRGLALAGLIIAVSICLVNALSGMGRAAPRVLLTGASRAGLESVIEGAQRHDLEILGVCLTDSDQAATELSGLPVVGRLSDIPELVDALGVEMVVAAADVNGRDLRRLAWSMESGSATLHSLPDVQVPSAQSVNPHLFGGQFALALGMSHRRPLLRTIKAVTERMIAAVLLLLLSPLLLFIAVAVRLDSVGSPIFRQRRIGLSGEPFTMYKFRTMTVDAESRLDALADRNEGAGPLFKLAADPRVTRIGRLLRHSSLDELPQLINVVNGTMSLVGPRPCLPCEEASYDDWTRRRLQVKPGITGAWQVSGRSTLSWEDSVRLDLDYVDSWTIRGDLSILARTAKAVIRGVGAW